MQIPNREYLIESLIKIFADEEIYQNSYRKYILVFEDFGSSLANERVKIVQDIHGQIIGLGHIYYIYENEDKEDEKDKTLAEYLKEFHCTKKQYYKSIKQQCLDLNPDFSDTEMTDEFLLQCAKEDYGELMEERRREYTKTKEAIEKYRNKAEKIIKEWEANPNYQGMLKEYVKNHQEIFDYQKLIDTYEKSGKDLKEVLDFLNN